MAHTHESDYTFSAHCMVTTLKSIFDKQILKKIFGVSNKKEYFRSNKSHHASQRCVPRWDFAFYKGYMDYDKQPMNKPSTFISLTKNFVNLYSRQFKI